MANARSRQRLSPLERFMHLFTEVRAGEGRIAVVMFATIFLILMSYYILKSVRDSEVVGEAVIAFDWAGELIEIKGPELKSYLTGFTALLLMGIVPAYGILASATSRIMLINICVTVVIASLSGFFILGTLEVPIAIPFFLFLSIINVFLIAQFFSLVADIFGNRQGKRLLPFVAIGASLGAPAGPALVLLLKELSTYALMGLAGLILVAVLFLYNVIQRLSFTLPEDEQDTLDGRTVVDTPLKKEGGFQLIFRKRYLLLMALMILVANIVNTTGEFVRDTVFAEHASEVIPDSAADHITHPVADTQADQRKEYLKAERKKKVLTPLFAEFYFLVNLFGAFIQAFLVSRIFKRVGVGVAIFFLPVIALLGYAAIGAIGGLLIVQIAKIAENSTDYSLQNTVRHALFLPTSREAKYKAKAAIDTFFVRVGDALSAVVVAIGINVLALGIGGFAGVAVGMTVISLVIVAFIGREYRKRTGEGGVARAK